jgi:hypothetical protein
MQAGWVKGWSVLGASVLVLSALADIGVERSYGEVKAERSAEESASIDDAARVPVAAARERARLMHEIYAATLDMMHERYFHGDRAIVPARAMQDVFTEIKRQSGTEARWIAVNLKAMSIDHEPKSDFEKRAAKELASGKAELEVVEDGYYRRAGAIPLRGGCIGCHAGLSTDASTAARFAGLVICVPVNRAADTSSHQSNQ